MTYPAPFEHLTEGQLKIAIAAAKGLSNREIAKVIGIRVQTVKFHMTAVLRRMGLDSRYKLIATVLKYDFDQQVEALNRKNSAPQQP